MSQRLDIGTFSCGRKNSLRAAIHWCYLLFDIVAIYILLILEVQEAVASYYYAGVALWVMNNEHASREKIISMVIFFIFVHKNVYRIRFQEIEIRISEGFDKMEFFSLFLMRKRPWPKVVSMAILPTN